MTYSARSDESNSQLGTGDSGILYAPGENAACSPKVFETIKQLTKNAQYEIGVSLSERGVSTKSDELRKKMSVMKSTNDGGIQPLTPHAVPTSTQSTKNMPRPTPQGGSLLKELDKKVADSETQNKQNYSRPPSRESANTPRLEAPKLPIAVNQKSTIILKSHSLDDDDDNNNKNIRTNSKHHVKRM